MAQRTGLLLITLALCLIMVSAGCTIRDDQPGRPADSGLVILTEENPPYNYRGADGEAAGQSTEIVYEIGRRLNQIIEIELLPWSEAYESAQHSPNVALFSTVRTPERDLLFAWVGPIGKQGFVFYAREGSGIAIDGIDVIHRQYTVAAVRDSWRHQYLEKQGFEELVLYPDDIMAIQGVHEGDADLWFGSSDSVIQNLRAAGLAPDALSPVYTLREIELFIAFNKDTDRDILRQWQAALDDMKRDGTFDEIVRFEQESMIIQPAGVSGAGKEALNLFISKVDGRIEGTKDTLRLLSTTSDLQSGDMAAIQPVLAHLREGDPAAAYSFINADGTWYRPGDALLRPDAGIRPYHCTLMAGTPVTGHIVSDPVTGREAAVVAVPVTREGDVIGYLEADIDLAAFSRSLAPDLALARTAYFSAITEDGVIILHTYPEKIGLVVAEYTDTFGEAIRSMIQEESGEAGYYEDGIYHQAAFRASGITGWRFFIAEQAHPPIPSATRAEEELKALLEMHD